MPSPGVNGSQIEVPLSGDLGERVPVGVTTTAGPVETRQMTPGKQTETVPRQSQFLLTHFYSLYRLDS